MMSPKRERKSRIASLLRRAIGLAATEAASIRVGSGSGAGRSPAPFLCRSLPLRDQVRVRHDLLLIRGQARLDGVQAVVGERRVTVRVDRVGAQDALAVL